MKVVAQLEPKIEYKCPCGECDGEGLSYFNGITYVPFENEEQKKKSNVCRSCDGQGSL